MNKQFGRFNIGIRRGSGALVLGITFSTVLPRGWYFSVNVEPLFIVTLSKA